MQKWSSMFVISVSGPQASGKTTLARALGAELGVPVFSRDPLMGAIEDAGYPVETVADIQRLGLAGYGLQGVLIDQMLAQGQSLVVECIAPAAVRSAWQKTAGNHSALYVLVDCVVSDRELHRQRLEWREGSGAGGWRRIKWEEVEATIVGLGPPGPGAIVADAVCTVTENVAAVVAALSSG